MNARRRQARPQRVSGPRVARACSRGVQTSVAIRTRLLVPALLLLSCGPRDGPNLLHLHEKGRFYFARRGAPVVAQVVRKDGLRALTTTLTDPGTTLLGAGTLTVSGDTLLAGVAIEGPADAMRDASAIELALTPRKGAAGTPHPPVARALEDGVARWDPVEIPAGRYEWSARLSLRPGRTAREAAWPKITLLWARRAAPGVVQASARAGPGDETRPALLMSQGTEVVCPLPRGGSWRLELGVAHPSASDGTGSIRVLVDHGASSTHLADLTASGTEWSDALLPLPTVPSGARLRISCATGAVLVGAPVLMRSPPGDARLDRRPNVLLVSLDTVRADHLDPWGDGSLTPGLARFAERSVVFERVVCQAPVTDASHHSIFTGLQVPRHGGERPFPLPEQIPTLAVMLADKGYRTAGFTDNNLVSAAFGFARGFDRYWEHTAPYGDKSHLEEILQRCNHWLARIGAHRPWFAFVHTYQAHSPYVNHESPEMPAVAVSPARQPATVESLPKHVETPGDARARTGVELLRMAKRNYASEIRYLDEVMTGFLDALEDSGRLDNTLVVILSDHGEGFLEHGFMAHDNSVFQELIHVPLLLRFPKERHAGTRVRDVVQTVDLLPTILAYVGVPAPETDGRSLLAACRTGEAGREVAICTDKQYYSITLWPYKLIVSRTGRESTLYRLDVDPEESKNLLAQAAPTLIDSLKAPLIDVLTKAHDGYMVILTRPQHSPATVVIEGIQTTELPVLFTEERDDLRATGRGLALRLAPSPMGDVVVLMPAAASPTVWTDPRHPHVIQDGTAMLDPFRVEVRRCRGIPPGRLRHGQTAVPPGLENRLRALGYVN
jgi:arylsulfatase A-like enzyme